jgi:hypothetical protein
MSNRIEIFDDHFSINEKRFETMLSLDVMNELLGESRLTKPVVEHAKSDIYTFDENGIWIYVKNGSIEQISILLSDPYLTFHPASQFRGDINIKGVSITNSDDFMKVQHKNIDLNEWEAEGNVSIELQKIHCNITLSYGTKDIEEISFWYDA